MTIGIVQMEVSFAPGCISWLLRVEPFFLEVSPQLINILHMEYDPSPVRSKTTLL